LPGKKDSSNLNRKAGSLNRSQNGISQHEEKIKLD